MFSCSRCNHKFYQNKEPTVAVIIPSKENEFEILMTKRNIAPHRGKFDLPGGFLEYEESPEDAAVREIKEELDLEIEINNLFTIKINEYVYQELLYLHTTIYLITHPIKSLPRIKDAKENSECAFFDSRRVGEYKKNMAFGPEVDVLQEYAKSLASNL